MRGQLTFAVLFVLVLSSQAIELDQGIDLIFEAARNFLKNYHESFVSDELPMTTREDLLHFAEGFLLGIGSAPMFKEIRECIQDAEEIFSDLNKGIQDIKTRDPAKVLEGIQLIGKATKFLPEAARTCKAAQADIKALEDLINTFRDPVTFLYKIGRSLLINRVEVYTEVTAAIDAYNNKDYTNWGYWVGKAMATIILKEDVQAIEALRNAEKPKWRYNMRLGQD